MGRYYANRLIVSSQVVQNLVPIGTLCIPCEIQPTSEYQVRPLTYLEPKQQKEVWEKVWRIGGMGEARSVAKNGTFLLRRIIRKKLVENGSGSNFVTWPMQRCKGGSWGSWIR